MWHTFGSKLGVLPWEQFINKQWDKQCLLCTAQTFEKVKILKLTFFQLEELQIAPSTSEGAPDYVREDCCPGAPYITFRAPPPGLSLTFINPQALSGHITHWLTVRNGDTIGKLATAVARQDKTIKGEPSLIMEWVVCFLNTKQSSVRTYLRENVLKWCFEQIIIWQLVEWRTVNYCSRTATTEKQSTLTFS